MKVKTILLLGAAGNAGMNFTKCLRMSKDYDYNIIGCDTNERSLKAVKHLYDKTKPIPPVTIRKVPEFLQYLEEEGVDFMHAQPDAEVKWLLYNPTVFAKYIFQHSLGACKKFSDKMRIQGTQACLTRTFIDIRDSKNPDEEFSLLNSTGKVWVRLTSGAGSRGALPVSTYRQAADWVNYWVQFKGHAPAEFMLSEFLPGKEYAVQTFWVKGSLLHCQARERVEYFFNNVMPSEQSSTPSVAAIVHDEDVYRAAQAAIVDNENVPHGIYCVDLKRDIKGTPIVMEVNYGRFFTTTDFLATAGVNTPDAYVRYFLYGERNTAIDTAVDGMWLRGLDREPTFVPQ